ncbi:MAG: DNA double-strand break repair nuclease NurA [Anaerolineaceae bacterium]|nr:DNA double-strand break repair nuclease NurA [Anaerolineaceae bacterium]
MPVNYQQTRQQIRDLGKSAQRLHDQFEAQFQDAEKLLQDNADNLSELIIRAEIAREKNKNFRCAIPAGEPLTQAYPLPETENTCVLLAADGSQINPDRHAQVEFGLINIGVIRMQPGSGITPQTFTSSTLLGEDYFHRTGDPIGEELIALERDLNERKKLAELAENESDTVIALTDGPLELYREPHQKSKFYEDKFKEYLDTLLKLGSLNAIPAGYVDKPRADLVIRMLGLLLTPQDDLGKANHKKFFSQIADVHLFAQLLPPESRSPIFGIQSPSASRYKDDLALHFFYLNVGRENDPSLARVEIPQWVAGSPAMINLLHAALIQECRQMGSRPYPYTLHRAHEVALVTFSEKEQLMQMIIAELSRLGVPISKISSKQFHKNITGNRTRL